MKLEVGMYVRTTYGIGRITNAYIVYDDDGSLWHLSYMTDNPKIELSIYTKNDSRGLFGEVQKDHRIKYEPLENNLVLVKKVYEQELEEITCYVPVNKNYPRSASLYSDHKFIKASFDIIDLIAIGDYVNGYEVVYEQSNDNFARGQKHLWLNDGRLYLLNKDIKTIITQEQMERITYKVGE